MVLLMIILLIPAYISATADMNLGEIEYLASHLKKEECNLLIANLMKYESLNDVPQVECIVNLIRWDRTYGRGKYSQDLVEPLVQIGREDLAQKLETFVFKESQFEFEHSPFFKSHEDEEPHTTDPAEKEFREGETVNEVLEEFEKESEKMEMGFIEKKTGYPLWKLILFITGVFISFALIFHIACGDSKWFTNLLYYLKNEVPVYCFGYTRIPFDKRHYDPKIHNLTTNVI